jgi:antitoxin VapB
MLLPKALRTDRQSLPSLELQKMNPPVNNLRGTSMVKPFAEKAYALPMYGGVATVHMSGLCRSDVMRTVSIFKNGKNQAIRLPTDMAYEGVGELEITRCGDTITLRPVRPSWMSLAELPTADDDFLQERPGVVGDEGRFNL